MVWFGMVWYGRGGFLHVSLYLSLDTTSDLILYYLDEK